MGFGPLIHPKREPDAGQRPDGADHGQPEQNLGDRFPGDDVGEQPGAGNPGARADLRQRAVERLVEAEHVDGEPAIALPDPRARPVEEDHQRGIEHALAMDLVEIRGDAGEHQRDDGNRYDEDQLLAERQPAEADSEHHRPERDTAAENAPIDRLQRDGVEPDQHGAGEGNGRDRQPAQEHGFVAVDLREPARQAGYRQDARP